MPASEGRIRVARGEGVVTAVEVTHAVDDLRQMDDPSVSDQFEKFVALERVMQKISDVPH